MRVWRRRLPGLGTALLVLSLPVSLRAQDAGGLPYVFPVNPIAQTRTGLYFQPLVDPSHGWRTSASLQYGSLIELNQSVSGQYLLDAEVARYDFSIGKDLSTKYFVRADLGIGSSAAGFMDGFFNWYHQLFGFRMPERERRPIDDFGYSLELSDGTRRVHPPRSYLGDARISIGRRHGRSAQTVASLTVPTGTGGSGYAKGVPSLAVLTTARGRASSRLLLEGSVGLGFTPRHGNLAPYQREVLGMMTSGFRFRIWGRQSLYANMVLQSAYYARTGYPALDRPDLSLNYGWIIRTGGGTEWKVGMTEDLAPTGPAIDAVFQFSVNWNGKNDEAGNSLESGAAGGVPPR